MSVVRATDSHGSGESTTSEKREKLEVICINNQNYELGDLLAEGGFGAVYRAKDTAGDDYPYAVKLTDGGQPQYSPHIFELRNPHIIQILGLGLFTRIDGTMCAATLMELAEGGSLNEHIGAGLRLRLITKYGKHLLTAIEYLHHHGLYHADIKPSNMLLKDRFKVTGEYRIVKLGDLDNVLSGTGTGLTRKYCPPWSSDTIADKQAADMWAFGCVLFEMAFGADKIIPQALQLFERRTNEKVESWVRFAMRQKGSIQGRMDIMPIDRHKPVCPLFHLMLKQCLVPYREECRTAREMLEHPFFTESDVFYPRDVLVAEGLAQCDLFTKTCKHCSGFGHLEVSQLTLQMCAHDECLQAAMNMSANTASASAGSSEAVHPLECIDVLPVHDDSTMGRAQQDSSLVHALEPHLHHSSQLELVSACQHIAMTLLPLKGFSYVSVLVTRPAVNTESVEALVSTLGAIEKLTIEWPDSHAVPVLQFPSDPFQVDEVVMRIARRDPYNERSAIRGNYIKRIRFDLGPHGSRNLDLNLCGSAMAHLEELIIDGAGVRARPGYLPSERFPKLRCLTLNSCSLEVLPTPCDCCSSGSTRDASASAVRHLSLNYVNGTLTEPFLQQLPQLRVLRLEWQKSCKLFTTAFDTGSRNALRLLSYIEFVPYDKFTVRFTRLLHLANVLSTFEVMDGILVVPLDQLVGAVFNVDLPENREIVEGRWKDRFRIISDEELISKFTQGFAYINQLQAATRLRLAWLDI